MSIENKQSTLFDTSNVDYPIPDDADFTHLLDDGSMFMGVAKETVRSLACQIDSGEIQTCDVLPQLWATLYMLEMASNIVEAGHLRALSGMKEAA